MFPRKLIPLLIPVFLLAGCSCGTRHRGNAVTHLRRWCQTPTPSESPASTEAPAATKRALVYFLIEGGVGPYLAREPGT